MFNCLVSNQAQAFTGGEVANEMTYKERSTYLAGVIGGLVQARWIKDRPDRSGMDCINRWYFQGDEAQDKRIQTWLARHPDKPASALLYVLAKKECGE